MERVQLSPFERVYVVGAALSALFVVLNPALLLSRVGVLLRWAQVEVALALTFLVFAMLSTLDAALPREHAEDVRALTLAVLMALVIAAIAADVGPEVVRRFLGFGSIAASLFLIVAPDERGWSGARLSALGQDPNELASYLGATVAIFAYLLIFGKAARRSVMFARFLLVGLILAGLLVTGSRGGLIATVAALILSVPLSGRVSVRSIRNLMGIALALGVLGLVGYLTIDPALLPVESTSLSRFFDAGAQSSNDRAGGRVGLYQLAFETMLRHPVLGVGAGGFSPGDDTETWFTLGAHNTFLAAGSQYGIPAAVALAVLTIRLIRRLFRSRDIEAQAIGAGLVALVVAGLTVSIEGEKVVWLVLGYSIALILRERRGKSALDLS